jgi:hypothetical protein
MRKLSKIADIYLAVTAPGRIELHKDKLMAIDGLLEVGLG